MIFRILSPFAIQVCTTIPLSNSPYSIFIYLFAYSFKSSKFVVVFCCQLLLTLLPSVDVLVLSDLLYYSRSLPALLHSIKDIFSRWPHCVGIMTHQQRCVEAEDNFFKQLRDEYDVSFQTIPNSKLPLQLERFVSVPIDATAPNLFVSILWSGDMSLKRSLSVDDVLHSLSHTS